jgi:ABC-type hemin transport system ATPase subunit
MKDLEARHKVDELKKDLQQLREWMHERDAVINALLFHLNLEVKHTDTIVVKKDGQ